MLFIHHFQLAGFYYKPCRMRSHSSVAFIMLAGDTVVVGIDLFCCQTLQYSHFRTHMLSSIFSVQPHYFVVVTGLLDSYIDNMETWRGQLTSSPHSDSGLVKRRQLVYLSHHTQAVVGVNEWRAVYSLNSEKPSSSKPQFLQVFFFLFVCFTVLQTL